MTSKTAVTDSALQQRLEIGAISTNGARGSLTRCARSVLRTTADLSTKDECLRELQLLQLEMLNRVAVLERYDLDVAATDTSAIEAEIAEEQAVVAALREELHQASSAQTSQMEYESLAKLVNTRHPTSRRVLQQQLDDLKAQHDEMQHELRQKEGQVKVREAQFHWFLQSMLDLKQSLTEPVELDAEEGEEMEMEPQEEDDEEGELYGDL